MNMKRKSVATEKPIQDGPHTLLQGVGKTVRQLRLRSTIRYIKNDQSIVIPIMIQRHKTVLTQRVPDLIQSGREKKYELRGIQIRVTRRFPRENIPNKHFRTNFGAKIILFLNMGKHFVVRDWSKYTVNQMRVAPQQIHPLYDRLHQVMRERRQDVEQERHSRHLYFNEMPPQMQQIVLERATRGTWAHNNDWWQAFMQEIQRSIPFFYILAEFDELWEEQQRDEIWRQNRGN